MDHIMFKHLRRQRKKKDLFRIIQSEINCEIHHGGCCYLWAPERDKTHTVRERTRTHLSPLTFPLSQQSPHLCLSLVSLFRTFDYFFFYEGAHLEELSRRVRNRVRQKQTPEVLFSILLNPSTDQYRYKPILEAVCCPACGSLLSPVFNTGHGELHMLSYIFTSLKGLCEVPKNNVNNNFNVFTHHVFQELLTLTQSEPSWVWVCFFSSPCFLCVFKI